MQFNPRTVSNRKSERMKLPARTHANDVDTPSGLGEPVVQRVANLVVNIVEALAAEAIDKAAEHRPVFEGHQANDVLEDKRTRTAIGDVPDGLLKRRVVADRLTGAETEV